MWLTDLLFGKKNEPASFSIAHCIESDIALSCIRAEQNIQQMIDRRKNEDDEIDSFLREGHSKLLTQMQRDLLEQKPASEYNALRNFDAGKKLLIEIANRTFGEYRTSFAISRCGLR